MVDVSVVGQHQLLLPSSPSSAPAPLLGLSMVPQQLRVHLAAQHLPRGSTRAHETVRQGRMRLRSRASYCS